MITLSLTCITTIDHENAFRIQVIVSFWGSFFVVVIVQPLIMKCVSYASVIVSFSLSLSLYLFVFVLIYLFVFVLINHPDDIHRKYILVLHRSPLVVDKIDSHMACLNTTTSRPPQD